jgi:toxin ParE1/3/4
LEKVRLMKVRFTPSATRYLAAIAQYLTERNPDAARRVGERIREVIELLADFPEIGHLGTLKDTREIVVPGLPAGGHSSLSLPGLTRQSIARRRAGCPDQVRA